MTFLHSMFVKIGTVISSFLIAIAGTISPTPQIQVAPVTDVATTSIPTETSTSATNIQNTTKESVAKAVPPVAIKPTSAPSPIANKTTPQASVGSTNPSAQCLTPKKDWETFSGAMDEINTKYGDLEGIYLSAAFGTGNRPKSLGANDAYNYTRMNLAKVQFTSSTDNIRRLLTTIPNPPLTDTSKIANIKTGISNTLDDLASSYDLEMSAFKMVVDAKDGMSLGELTTQLALMRDSSAASNKSNSEYSVATAVMKDLQDQMNLEYKSIGCTFTFKGKTILTTIHGESDFMQTMPTVKISPDYTSATVTLKTPLPVQLNGSGQVNTVMQLSCSVSLTTEILPAQQIDKDTVQATVSPTHSSDSTHHCSFVYTGSGTSINTKMIDFSL